MLSCKGTTDQYESRKKRIKKKNLGGFWRGRMERGPSNNFFFTGEDGREKRGQGDRRLYVC